MRSLLLLGGLLLVHHSVAIRKGCCYSFVRQETSDSILVWDLATMDHIGQEECTENPDPVNARPTNSPTPKPHKTHTPTEAPTEKPTELAPPPERRRLRQLNNHNNNEVVDKDPYSELSEEPPSQNTGWTQGKCPKTADEANQLMFPEITPAPTAPFVPPITWVVSSAFGITGMCSAAIPAIQTPIQKAIATTMGVNASDVLITGYIDYEPQYCDPNFEGSYSSYGYSAYNYEPGQVPTVIIHYRIEENEATPSGRLDNIVKGITQMNHEFNGQSACTDVLTGAVIACEQSELMANILNELSLDGFTADTSGTFINAEHSEPAAMVQITYAPTPVPGERYKDEFGIYRCDTWDAAALGGQGAWKNDNYECEDQSDPPAPDAGPGAGVVVGGIFGGLAAVGLLAFLYARSKAGGEAYALKPNAMFRQGGSRL